MKVKELIKQLKNLDNQDAEVIIASDAEGNSYSPLSDISDSLLYDATNSWSGEIYSTVGAEDGSEEGLDDAIPVSGIPAIVLHPIN